MQPEQAIRVDEPFLNTGISPPKTADLSSQMARISTSKSYPSTNLQTGTPIALSEGAFKSFDTERDTRCPPITYAEILKS
jgi:hypothetical protein